MSEFRQNLVNKEWVIISTERAKRPDKFVKKAGAKQKLVFDPSCPFCPGNESQTPKEVFQISRNSQWSLRVVPNKFAAVDPETSPDRVREGRYRKFGGFGFAEVVIETPSHNQTIGTMSLAEVQDVVYAYRERYLAFAADTRLDLITIFRNHGQQAGTSLEHPHSQIIATPLVPLRVRQQIEEARRYCDDNGTCVFCDMLSEELADGRRVVMENKSFVAFEPYASRSPFDTLIMPKVHQSVFGRISPAEVEDLAFILKGVLGKLYAGLGDPDYNYVLQSAPREDDNVEYFHWYIRLIPRITTPAGFEIGTGIYINIVYPEEAAKFLRETPIPQ